MRRTAGVIALGAAAAVVTAGCGPTITNVTLPGGATSSNVFGSKPTNTYTVMFDNALDLVPQASVKMNDVSIGDVRSVALLDGKAKVTIRVLKSVTVPANVLGVLGQTSLLGEKFVDLVVPSGGPQQGSLPPGATIGTDDTSQEVQVEDVFGALSELLNGGGIQQLQAISVDLAQVLKGRETNIRDLLKQLTVFATTLDSRRDEIVRALDSVNALAKTLDNQRGVIIEALRDIAPGLKDLDESRKDLVNLLQGLNRLGGVAVNLEKKTQADTINDLRTLQPTLDRLNQAGDSIIGSLQLLVTYPFGDNALKAIFSDYTGLYASLTVDLRNGSTANPLGPDGLCAAVPSQGDQSLCAVLTTIEGALPALPTVPGLSGSNAKTAPTKVAPSTGPAATLPSKVLGGTPATGAGASASPSPSPSGLIGSVLGGLTAGDGR